MRQNSRRTRHNLLRSTASILVTTVLFSVCPLKTFALSFSDVSTTNRNATAIDFLAKNNIISGYSDGTFQPEKSVSRVEFLKLALLSSQVKLDATTPTGFSDIDENAWYAPYLRKAKKEGWVQGYGDNTFKPTRAVNKVEGLKIIAKIQAWTTSQQTEAPFKDTPTNEWYTPFVAYGKYHNFLEETGNFFIPSSSLSRAKTSEILFRALITKGTGATTYTPDLINKFPADFFTTVNTNGGTTPPSPSTPVSTNFTPVSYKTITKTSFDNITLNEDFPNTFYVNEFYNFEGKINTGTYDNAFVFIRNDVDETFENITDKIQNGTFNIPVIFRKAGNYQLGVVPGNAGESKYIEISVLNDLPKAPTSGSSTVPTSLGSKYVNQTTTFTWNNGTDNLARLTFSQGSMSKTFFTRQNNKRFDVIYNDFQNFKPGSMSFKVESAKTSQTKPLIIESPWTSSTSQSFTATGHTYSEVHKDQISYSTLPETLTATGNINLSGKTLSDIYKNAYVISPDGKINHIDLKTTATTMNYFGSVVIPKGSDYSFTYPATTNGTYIVEINGKDGLAVINMPVYVNNGLPLIPDFFDLENAAAPDTNVSTNILSNNLLKLINQERVKYNLPTVTADAELNKLAQLHADDMLNRDFFGHINPDGKSPNDRRLALGIKTDVGENLARAPNLLYAHNGLMRSAIHRSNILEPDWSRVGIGISKTSDDYVLVVEEFSTDVLDSAKLASMKNSLYTEINNKRQTNGVTAASKDSTLESVAENWSTAMATKKFFDFTAPDGSSLPGNVQKAVPNRSVQMYILESSSQSQLLEEMYSSTEALKATWKTIGLGLQADTDGALKLTILLST